MEPSEACVPSRELVLEPTLTGVGFELCFSPEDGDLFETDLDDLLSCDLLLTGAGILRVLGGFALEDRGVGDVGEVTRPLRITDLGDTPFDEIGVEVGGSVGGVGTVFASTLVLLKSRDPLPLGLGLGLMPPACPEDLGVAT